MKQRVLRRDRAARIGVELFLYERAFEDCLERIALIDRRFERALLIGCPDPGWPVRLGEVADELEIREPGSVFAKAAGAQTVVEDRWMPPEAHYDLVLAVGTLDTVNDLPLCFRLIGHAMRRDALLIGALSGGETMPQLRTAMRAADAASGAAAPHIHPRIEAAALAPLLTDAGFIGPVVDVDRAMVSYPSLERLIQDLRAMGATNILMARPRCFGKAAREAARRVFTKENDGSRTTETFEILHFAAWTPKDD
jgi:NADH dehydrogenase [ubiquinone] 1 alpha subcomplex assembly factor 5